MLSTEAERNEVMIAAVLVYSVVSYEVLKDEISSCRHEMSIRNFVSCREISFRFITLLANNRCHRNFAAFSSETKVCNLFSV